MKIITSIFLLVAISMTLNAENPNDLAVKIIKSQSSFGYNFRDESQEEIAHGHAMNSKMRLNWLMVNDKSVSEELKTCYAIKLLDDALGLQKTIRSGMKPLPKEELMMKQRLILGARLAELAKAEQDSAHQSTTRSESKSK